MIDLEQLKADRKAGTEGGWVASKYLGDKDGWFVRSYGQESICGKGSIGLSEANARRIARLPDLEAAYIDAVAKLDKAVEALQEIDNIAGAWPLSGGYEDNLDMLEMCSKVSVKTLTLIAAKSEINYAKVTIGWEARKGHARRRTHAGRRE